MDESGFIQRPYKNTSRNCVYIKTCSVAPCFSDYIDGNHVSVVFKLLLISTTINPQKEVINSPLYNNSLWLKNKSSYLNEEAMIFWLQNILIPYLKEIQKKKKNTL